MIEQQIGKGLRDYFLPLTTETELIEKIEALGNWSTVKKRTKGNWSSILITNGGVHRGEKRLITAMLIVYNEAESKIIIMANIGENDFPRIITVANFENAVAEIENELNFLYGRGKNFMYVYSAKDKKTAKEELDPIGFEKVRKSPWLFYLMKGHRKLTFNVKSNHENKKKARVILSSAQDFLMNKFAISKKLEDLSAKEFMTINREVNERILFECFFGGNTKRTAMSMHRALNQRSMFLGAFLYEILINRVSYEEESWYSFFQTVAENFKAEAEEILKEIEEAVVRESLEGMSTRMKSYIMRAYGGHNPSLAIDWLADTISLTRKEIELYGDKLFSKDEYMPKSIEKLIKERIKFVAETMEEYNLSFSRTRNVHVGNPSTMSLNTLSDFIIRKEEIEEALGKNKPKGKCEDNIPF